MMTFEAPPSDLDAKQATRSTCSTCMLIIIDEWSSDHHHRVVFASLDEDAWDKRRANDGFVPVVAQPVFISEI